MVDENMTITLYFEICNMDSAWSHFTLEVSDSQCEFCTWTSRHQAAYVLKFCIVTCMHQTSYVQAICTRGSLSPSRCHRIWTRHLPRYLTLWTRTVYGIYQCIWNRSSYLLWKDLQLLVKATKSWTISLYLMWHALSCTSASCTLRCTKPWLYRQETSEANDVQIYKLS